MVPFVSLSLLTVSHSILSRDGMNVLDDEMFIVNNVLMYHPEKEEKMSGQGNYIMVSPFSSSLHEMEN